MYIIEHPEITCCLRTGYPSWMQEDDDLDEEWTEQDAYDEYCDRCYEERRDAKHGWE
jgi:hypothetical protein